MKQLHAVTMQTSIFDGLKKGVYDKRLARLGIDEHPATNEKATASGTRARATVRPEVISFFTFFVLFFINSNIHSVFLNYQNKKRARTSN